MFKRLLSIVLVLSVVVGVFSGCASTNKPQAAATIKIGLAVPLTGDSAQAGTRIERGAKLAVKDINAAGGLNGRMVELVEMDDQSDPKQAANIASLFVENKDMLACIADYNSSCTLAGAPIYNAGHLVQLNLSTSPKVSDAGPYTFRVWNSETYRALYNLQTILDAGYTKIGILYENDDFGLGGLKVAQDELTRVGLKALVSEGFLLGETKDFKTIITKMKNAGCQAVFAIADETELAAFATQCGQQNWKPFISSEGTYDPGVIKLGGKYVEGMVGDCYFDPGKLPAKAAAFFKEYHTEYSAVGDTSDDAMSPCAYDSINIVAAAIKNGAKTREDIQAYMATLKDYDGVIGTLSFDKNGDMMIPMVRVIIKNGNYVLYTGK